MLWYSDYAGSRICSPKPKSRSSIDAILPSFVIKIYSPAVLGIQSSSYLLNKSVLYQTTFSFWSTLISRLLQISRGSAVYCANSRSLSSNLSKCIPVPHAMTAPASFVEALPQHSSKMKQSFSLLRLEKIPLPDIGFPYCLDQSIEPSLGSLVMLSSRAPVLPVLFIVMTEAVCLSSFFVSEI